MSLTNKTYDTIKWITTILLPASGTLYFALSQIWGLPNAEQVVGTIAALTTFLGVLLGISTSSYNKAVANGSDGTLQVDLRDPNKDIYRLQLNEQLETLADKKTITLVVDPNAKLS
jgi:Putative phage holin Dp-1